MDGEHKTAGVDCPVPTATAVEANIRHAVDELLGFCGQDESTFRVFETTLLQRLLVLGCLLVQLYLRRRHERLAWQDQMPPDGYRVGAREAPRTLKTLFGAVTYWRTQFLRKQGGSSYHPLDVALGLTRDSFSPWVIQFVTRLATRMSFAASQLLCRSVLGWSPSTEAIEDLVLGLGRQAQPFAQQQAAPANDGEVLVIEVDGKCPPTARAEELRKRRGPRARHAKGCACGCQRHRGQAKRKRRGTKKRRKKGDKSKNGKEVVVVVMYTLQRGEDGRLHGPVNKKVWASFGGRKRAARWARAEATKRGFGPATTKTVQIVVDGANGLKSNLEVLFPKAIFTVDVCHVVEKLWSLGRRYHAEGSAALQALVGEWKELVYAGRAAALLDRLRQLLAQVAPHGPGTKGKRKALASVIGYLEPRLAMMDYAAWREQDLVIASGQVEGAVRHVVGERLDCAGMRWIPGRAEALLQLRCIELNGDWEEFIAWSDQRYQQRLDDQEAVVIRSKKLLRCRLAEAA
jgi:deoxycytidylate deaminase